MKNVMTMVAVVAALGVSGLGQAAQQELKPGQDRVKAEYGSVAKTCDGLKGDAKTACLKDIARDQNKGKGAAAAHNPVRDEKK